MQYRLCDFSKSNNTVFRLLLYYKYGEFKQKAKTLRQKHDFTM